MTAPDDIGIGDICSIVPACRCGYMAQFAGRDCEVTGLLGMQPKWKGCCPAAPTDEEVFRVRIRGNRKAVFFNRSELRKQQAAAQALQVPVIEPQAPAAVAH